jgi:hypothetical protein
MLANARLHMRWLEKGRLPIAEPLGWSVPLRRKVGHESQNRFDRDRLSQVRVVE